MKKPWPLIVILCALISAVGFGEDINVQKDIAAGDEAQSEWDYAEAIRCYSKALQKDPLNVEALSSRAFMYTRIGELEKAFFDSTRAIQLDSKHAPAYFARGIAFRRRDNLDKAISDLSEAVRLEPGDDTYVGLRGDLYAEHGSLKKAMADYNRAVELNPKAAVNFCRRGDLRMRVGDYAAAASDYLQSQKIDPDYAAPYISYAWLLAVCPDERIRNGAEALKYAKIGLDLNPKREDSWAAYAAALGSAGRFDEAVEWQERYLKAKVLNQTTRIQAEAELDFLKSHRPVVAPRPEKLSD